MVDRILAVRVVNLWKVNNPNNIPVCGTPTEAKYKKGLSTF